MINGSSFAVNHLSAVMYTLNLSMSFFVVGLDGTVRIPNPLSLLDVRYFVHSFLILKESDVMSNESITVGLILINVSFVC